MIILGWRLRVPPFKETPILLTYERGTTNNRKKKRLFSTTGWGLLCTQRELHWWWLGWRGNRLRKKPMVDWQWKTMVEKYGKTWKVWKQSTTMDKKHVEKKMFVEGLPVGIEEQLEWLTVEYGSISENLTFSLVALCQQVTQVDQKEGASISHVSCYSSST